MEINYGNQLWKQTATKDVTHRVGTCGKYDGQYNPSLGCHCDQVKENYQQTGLEHTHSKDWMYSSLSRKWSRQSAYNI